MPYPVFAKNHARSRYSGARVVAKVEWHNGELIPRVGFIVTNLKRPAKSNRDALKTHQLLTKRLTKSAFSAFFDRSLRYSRRILK